MKILALSGSLRANSYNTAIVKILQKLNSDVEIYEDLENLPLFNPDLDKHTLEEDNSPNSAVAFREKVRACDVFVISTLKYAHQVSGVDMINQIIKKDTNVTDVTIIQN